MIRKSDWLIVIVKKEFHKTIDNALEKIKPKFNWRSFNKNNLKFYVFDGKPISTINKIFMAINSSKLTGIIYIDDKGIF